MADLGEIAQAMLAVHPPEARGLHPAPRCLGRGVRVKRVVVHHRAGEKLVGDPIRPLAIAGEDVR